MSVQPYTILVDEYSIHNMVSINRETFGSKPEQIALRSRSGMKYNFNDSSP